MIFLIFDRSFYLLTYYHSITKFFFKFFCFLGNCNPKFMRSSLYIAPATSDILKHSQIPFVVAISPFAPLHPNEVSFNFFKFKFQ